MKTFFHTNTAWLLASLVFLSGCIFYQRYPMAKSRLAKIEKSELTFYILDAARPASRVWYVSEADFRDDSMTGFLIRLDELEAQEVATIRGRQDARYSKDDVLIYVKPKFAIALGDTITTTIAYEQLEKIEVHEVNHSKSVAISLLCGFMPLFFFTALLFSY
ncbi:MAG: hypothetical protein KIS77_01430 [Saprospiraceae bacterium]|nr:hypothetical protein [Saprospiraceae bacterium]